MNFNAFIIFLLITIASCYGKSIVEKYPIQDSVCNTSGCAEAARFISTNIDTTVNPCDNFYQFACGNYIRDHSIADDGLEVSICSQAIKNIHEKLKLEIEEKIDKDDPKIFHVLKSYYHSCLNADSSEKNSTQILLDNLGKLNGWPVIVGQSWNESIFDWKHVIYQLREMGYLRSTNAFLKFSIDVDKKNSTRSVIKLDESTRGFDDDYLSKGSQDKMVQAYFKYMVDLATMLGADPHRAEKELTDSLNFEIEMAKIATEQTRKIDELISQNSMTVEQLQLKFSYINWTEYLNRFLKPRHRVEMSETIIIDNPIYFERLSDLILKYPKRTLANYIMFQVVFESVGYMDKRFLNLETEFYSILYGIKNRLPGWKECIYSVSSKLPIAVGALYVRKDFDKTLKNNVEIIVNDMRGGFETILNKVDWMDEKTKGRALKKLKSIQARVAYPKEYLDDDKLDEYFKDLKEQPDSYLDSYLSTNLFNFDHELQLLRKPVEKYDWAEYGNAAEFNAFYFMEENSIVIKAGYLPKEFFNTNRPVYMNYAAIGSIIGHELSHGFDNEGSQYDENGNLENWWDSETYKKYLNRTHCLIEQYNNYSVAELGMNINGMTTLGENIADNGGVKQAYFAYDEYERRNGPEPQLPGLSYSARQLFWITHATTTCEKFRPEAAKNKLVTDSHCPSEFRVIGSLSNMPEFARDFNCPIGSPMNPTKKCTVW